MKESGDSLAERSTRNAGLVMDMLGHLLAEFQANKESMPNGVANILELLS